MIRVRILTLLSLAPTAVTSLLASATPPPAVFKDNAGNVYIHSGVNAGDRLKVELIGQPFKKMVRAGSCGQITLSPTAAMPSLGKNVTVGGKTIDLTTITSTNTAPKCTNGAFAPATTTNFKTSKGKVELVGYTAGQSYSVLFNDLPNHFNATVNSCAFAAIKSTPNRHLTSLVQINGMTYTISNLPTAEPPVCRKNSGTSTASLYVPSSWK